MNVTPHPDDDGEPTVASPCFFSKYREARSLTASE